MIDVAERGLGERPQRLARYHQHVLAEHVFDPHAVSRDLLVWRGVRPERKQRRVLIGRNGFLLVGEGGGGVHGVSRWRRKPNIKAWGGILHTGEARSAHLQHWLRHRLP